MNSEIAADYVKKEEEKREKLRKLRNEEKLKSDEKLKEKLRKRKDVSKILKLCLFKIFSSFPLQKPSHSDVPHLPPPRKQQNQSRAHTSTTYENVEINQGV